MSPITTDLGHDGWNPTPINGQLTAELGNPFRPELHDVDTSLPVDCSIEAIEKAANEAIAQELADHPPITVMGSALQEAAANAVAVITTAGDKMIEAFGGPSNHQAAEQAIADSKQNMREAAERAGVPLNDPQPPNDSQDGSEAASVDDSPSDEPIQPHPRMQQLFTEPTVFTEPEKARPVPADPKLAATLARLKNVQTALQAHRDSDTHA